MCIVLALPIPVQGVDLVVLHNRDEFFSRPFQGGQNHSRDGNPIYFGTDIKSGGTWLAASKSSYSAVLNVRSSDIRSTPSLSRGGLPLAALEAVHFERFANNIPRDQYGLFRLIKGTVSSGVEEFYSPSGVFQRAEPSQIFTSTNRMTDHKWEKETRLKALFQGKIAPHFDAKALAQAALEALSDRHLSDEPLPTDTGYPDSLEHLLSPVYVDIPEKNYGTVVSTVLVYRKNKSVLIAEKKRGSDEIRYSELF